MQLRRELVLLCMQLKRKLARNSLLRVLDLTANKFVYALIAESLSILQAADTSQALVLIAPIFCFYFKGHELPNRLLLNFSRSSKNVLLLTKKNALFHMILQQEC